MKNVQEQVQYAFENARLTALAVQCAYYNDYWCTVPDVIETLMHIGTDILGSLFLVIIINIASIIGIFNKTSA